MKVLTWNAQGYTGQVEKFVKIRNWLNSGEYDVICIQEAGHALGSFNPPKECSIPILLECEQPHFDRKVKQIQNYYAIDYRWGNNNNRCSMVTYVKKERYSSHCLYAPSPYKSKRGILCVSIKTKTGNITIGNIHLTSGNQQSAYREFITYYKHLKKSSVPFIIIGDFNIDAFSNPKVISPEKHFYYVNVETQKSGGCLDYAYSEIYNPIQYGILAPPENLSDHAPVFYVFPDPM